MKTCYVIENVPENELENVKDGVVVDGCIPKVERQSDGKYKVSALCDDD